MPDFVVKLDVKMSDAEAKRIAHVLQRAVLSELSGVDTGGGKAGAHAEGGDDYCFYIPPRWRGIWAFELANIKNVSQIGGTQMVVQEKQIGG